MLEFLDLIFARWQWYRRLRKGKWRKYRLQWKRHFNELGFNDRDEWERVLTIDDNSVREFYGQSHDKIFLKVEDYD